MILVVVGLFGLLITAWVTRSLHDAEQERLERFIQIKILAGAATPGVYPANDKTKAEYKDWIAAGEPKEWRR